MYIIRFDSANTGASTLNINNIGAKAIETNKLTALSANDIKQGAIHILIYDMSSNKFQAISIHV